MKYFKANIALILLLLISSKILAQSNFSPSVPIPTSSSITHLAASSSTVNMQTGTAIVNIPLYQGETPIGINYSAAGNRPEVHPGWTGQGWSLSVGGSISRIVKGDYDENYETGGAYDSNCRPHPSIPGQTICDYNQQDNYFERGTTHLAETAWSSTGSTFSIPDNCNLDYEPDEFKFSFMGYSGTFYYSHRKQWEVIGDMKGKVKISSYGFSKPFIFPRKFTNSSTFTWAQRKQVLSSFVLTANDGTEYTFGSYNINYEAVEFIYPLDKNSKGKMPMPVTWHLSEIKYTDGKKIVFNYEKDGFNILRQDIKAHYKTRVSHTVNNNGVSTVIDIDVPEVSKLVAQFTVIEPSYIASIVTPYETVKFIRGDDTDLNTSDYNLERDIELPETWTDPTNINIGWEEYGINRTLRKWPRLDKIQFFNNANVTTTLKSYLFEYEKSLGGRRCLKKVTEQGLTTQDKLPSYRFEYNGEGLPSYSDAIDKIDNFGFYDGGKRAGVSVSESLLLSYQQAEILNNVIYPTGGSESYEYEFHDYSGGLISISPFTANSPIQGGGYGADELTFKEGGIRIKKIKTYDGTSFRNKQYIYKKDYTNANVGVSSGIKDIRFFATRDAVGSNLFTNNLNYSIDYFYEINRNVAFSANDYHVFYSEVVEKSDDNSYTTYKFSNIPLGTTTYPDTRDLRPLKVTDNACCNMPPGFTFKDPYTSKNLLRGKLLEKLCYNANDKLVHKAVNYYNTTFADADNIRAVRSIKRDFGVGQTCRKAAYLVHGSPINLIETQEFTYNELDLTGTNTNTTDFIATTSYYKYTTDGYNNLKETKTITGNPTPLVSGGTEANGTDIASNIVKTFKYANDITDNTTNIVKSSLLGTFMVGIPIESCTNNECEKTEYKSFSNVGLMPWKSFRKYSINTNISSCSNETSVFGTETWYLKSEIQSYIKGVETNAGAFPTQIKAACEPNVTTLTWNKGLLTERKFLEAWTIYDYYFDTHRQLKEETAPDGIKNTYAYDNYFRLSNVNSRNNTIETACTYGIGVQLVGASYVNNNKTSVTTIYKNLSDASKNQTITNSEEYDWLGKTVRKIKVGGNLDGSDYISTVLYDNVGRPSTSIDPASGNGTSSSSYYASPLSRTYQVIPVGAYSGKSITYQYGRNETTDNVKDFNNGSGTTNYPVGTLSKAIVTDENGNQSVSFTDKRGLTVLSRRIATPNNTDTYYKYNSKGQSVEVIPPGATLGSSLTFKYQYYDDGASWKQTTPDKGTKTVVYNLKGQLASSTDPTNTTVSFAYDVYGNMTNRYLTIPSQSVYNQEIEYVNYYKERSWGIKFGKVERSYNYMLNKDGYAPATSGWNFLPSYPQYDDLGRYLGGWHISIKGWEWSQLTYKNASDLVEGAIHKHKEPSIFTLKTTNEYDNRGRNLTSTFKVERNLNCQYDYAQGGYIDCQADSRDYSYYKSKQTYNNNGWMTHKSMHQNYGGQSDDVAKIQNIAYQYNDRGWLTKINNIDNAGNPINQCNVTDNSSCMKEARNLKFKLYYNIISTPYGYLWDAQYNMMSLTHRPTDYYDTVSNTDVVNTSGSSANTSYQIDLVYAANVIDAANLEDFAWQVAYNAMFTSGVYDWNLVNAVYNFVYNSLNGKFCRDKLGLFAEVLHYYDGNTTLSAPAQYDGKIAWAEWQTSGVKKQAYGYEYDALNRMKKGTYGISNTSNNYVTSSANYTEQVEYDIRGNIEQLHRWGVVSACNTTTFTFGKIDQLSYQYSPNTNKIKWIKDAITTNTKGFTIPSGINSQADPIVYDYDANGNMKSDLAKGISSIKYNFLDLPYEIVFSSGRKTTMLYAANGEKLQRKVYNASGTLEATYDYAGPFEYLNNDIEAIYFSDGRVRIDNTDGYLKYDYFLKDHLGTNRIVFTNKISYSEGNAGVKNIVILQENQLYPYGLNTEGAWAIAAPFNRYQYSDKEWNSELKWNDHGARLYDPAIGRWWVTDPANQYASPYKAMGNNPVSHIDNDGQWAWLIPIAYGALTGGLVEAEKAERQGKSAMNGFWRGALVGGLSGGLANIGGGSLLSNIAWGAAEGAVVGGLDAGLRGSNVFNGIKNGALYGAGFGALSTAIEASANLIDGHGFRTNDGVIEHYIGDNGTLEFDKLFAFTKKRYGLDPLSLDWDFNLPDYGATKLDGSISFGGPSSKSASYYKATVAHEYGHSIVGRIVDAKGSFIAWDKGSGILNPIKDFQDDGAIGFANEIFNIGRMNIKLSVIREANPLWYEWSNQLGGGSKWIYAIPRRFNHQVILKSY